jgi:nucleotide-binding universal stress UspA family protein
MITLRRILVPTDFSEHSRKALMYAAAFAEKFGAEITLLHVYQNLPVFQPDAATGGPSIIPPVDQLTGPVHAALEREIRESNLQGLGVRHEMREGAPHEEIVQFAKDKETDLIIMGTHGRGWLAHVLLGSVAEKVVRKAPCPVLTVRHPEHEFVKP